MPQTPGDAIADAKLFFEHGLHELETYLEHWADFRVYEDEHPSEVEDE